MEKSRSFFCSGCNVEFHCAEVVHRRVGFRSHFVFGVSGSMHRFDVHRIFYGHQSEMTNYQIRVYGSPRIRAITAIGADKEKAQTAIVLALSMAFDPAMRTYLPVYLFVPERHVGWLVVQVQNMAEELVKRLRAEQTPDTKEATTKILRILREWIANIRAGKPDSWMSVAPERWVAFGYTENDDIPAWVKTALG